MQKNKDKQRLEELRKKAQSADPIVRIGKSGLTESVADQIRKALKKRKLIKVRMLRSFLESGGKGKDKDKIAQELAEKTGSEMVNRTGFNVTLHRR